ncbi:hydrogenase nickel incorporation protein HypB [Brevibacillus thermoruber]|uniref:Hydrogenase nickel incorporation protein HypB n=1 Tax=Brevibacillus thermoruber TaxID=33942 RepID=A0A9X3TM74_9BACL|nr:hydrogenase nickel incorporation protein HypB [Brevibacillus thermoruber]MDA5107077.1 hydrogenase nickel incorporation protein HypB [Brevibacillus thermoruber]
MSQRIYLQQQVLQGNQRWAQENRTRFQEHALLVVNVIGSPGAGKTTLLESMIPYMKRNVAVGVIEGDVATTIDSERMARCGIQTVQINTHGACHLDAKMIASASRHFSLSELDLLIIENVGNLVCPTDFDLGEEIRVVVLSTAEGSDKVQKYPAVFQQAHAVVLNKIDLLPYVSFDLDVFHKELFHLNKDIRLFPVSALKGKGVEEFSDWLMTTRGEAGWKG